MAKIRFRKTFDLGVGAKVTASKSGIGASVDAKVAQIGRGVDGRTRIKGSISGMGLSAQHAVGGAARPAASASAAPSLAPAPLARIPAIWILLGVIALLFVPLVAALG